MVKDLSTVSVTTVNMNVLSVFIAYYRDKSLLYYNFPILLNAKTVQNKHNLEISPI